METATTTQYIRWFEDLGSDDVPLVGGKNASLGEMVHALKEEGIRVPDGFAVTADAYWQFLRANDLTDRIRSHLEETSKRSRCPARRATRATSTRGSWTSRRRKFTSKMYPRRGPAS